MKKLLVILFIMFLFVCEGQTEESLINELALTGNVTDVNGMPLTGVAISFKDASKVVKTNFDGDFNIKAKVGAILVVSYTGFKSQLITVGHQNKMNIILEVEGKSETIRAITQSEIRKKKRQDNKAKRQAKNRKNDESLEEWLVGAAGRSLQGAIRKRNRQKNN